MLVAFTAFVDPVFPSADPVVEDETRPYPTITAALAGVEAAAGPDQIWRIVVRPGDYAEPAALVFPLYVEVVGSGKTTTVVDVPGIMVNQPTLVYLADMVGVTLSGMTINLTAGANVQINSTLIVQSTTMTFTPTTAAGNTTVFAIAGPDSPALTIRDSTLNQATSTAGTPAGQLPLVGVVGTALDGGTVTITMTGVTTSQRGSAPCIAQLSGSFLGGPLINLTVADSVFNLALFPDSTAYTGPLFLYGGSALTIDASFLMTWSVTTSTHNATLGTGSTNDTLYAFYLTSPTGTPVDVGADDAICYATSNGFNLTGFASPSNAPTVFAAENTLLTPNPYWIVDNTWIGQTLVTGTATTTSYPPLAALDIVAPIVYEDITGNGSLVTGGGLQTGVTNVGATLGSGNYTVSDTDGIIMWAPDAASTITFPIQPNTVGKWVSVINTGIFTITIIVSSGTGSANGVVVDAGASGLFQTTDGSAWYLVPSGNLMLPMPAFDESHRRIDAPSRTQRVEASQHAASLGVHEVLTARVRAPSDTVLVGGGFRVNVAADQVKRRGFQWSPLVNEADADDHTQWVAQIVNTGPVPIDDITLVVSALAMHGN